jgi:hypothetical protein
VAEINCLVFGAEDPPPPGVTLLALLEKLPPDKAGEIVELVHGVLKR